ncbi:MAG: hypothetical protein AAFX94_03390 [Myxococcota bacterium]
MVLPRILRVLARRDSSSIVFEAYSLPTLPGGYAGLRWRCERGRVYIEGLGWFSREGTCLAPMRSSDTTWRLWSVSGAGVLEASARLKVSEIRSQPPDLRVPTALVGHFLEPRFAVDPVLNVPAVDVAIAPPTLRMPAPSGLKIDPPEL